MSKGLLDASYRICIGKKIDVYFDMTVCQHSGNCMRGSAELFSLKHKPWTIPGEVGAVTVIKVINTCPSDALKYRQR